jgi:predicted membrane protein
MAPEEWRETWSEDLNSSSRATSGALVSGLVIAGIGIVLLLDRFDVVSASILFRLWPLVFVFIGVGRLLESHTTSDQVWCGFLISIGSLLTLHELGFIRWGIGQLWPLFLIGAGLMLAWHSNEIRIGRKGISLPEGARFSGIGGGPLTSVAFFGGIERRVEGTIVEGGNLIAFFGGFKIDLSRAEMEGERTIIDATAIFGGGEIIVPEWWKVSVEGLGIFGGYVDKTRHVPRPERPVKTVIVRGAAIFGGIEVKSY